MDVGGSCDVEGKKGRVGKEGIKVKRSGKGSRRHWRAVVGAEDAKKGRREASRKQRNQYIKGYCLDL